MRLRPFFLLVFGSALLSLGSAAPQGRKNPDANLQMGPLSARAIEPQDISGVTLVDALLEIGQRGHVPIGIEYVDEKSLSATISVHSKETTVAGALSLILPGSSGYTLSERYGVIDVTHTGAPTGSLNLLDHVLPAFDAPRSSLDKFSFELEMALLHDLSPETAGFGGDYISSGPPVLVGPLRLRGASVREILSRAASEERPAAWVITAPPAGLSRVPSNGLWKLLPYTEPPTHYSLMLLQAFRQASGAVSP